MLLEVKKTKTCHGCLVEFWIGIFPILEPLTNTSTSAGNNSNPSGKLHSTLASTLDSINMTPPPGKALMWHFTLQIWLLRWMMSPFLPTLNTGHSDSSGGGFELTTQTKPSASLFWIIKASERRSTKLVLSIWSQFPAFISCITLKPSNGLLTPCWLTSLGT